MCLSRRFYFTFTTQFMLCVWQSCVMVSEPTMCRKRRENSWTSLIIMQKKRHFMHFSKTSYNQVHKTSRKPCKESSGLQFLHWIGFFRMGLPSRDQKPAVHRSLLSHGSGCFPLVWTYCWNLLSSCTAHTGWCEYKPDKWWKYNWHYNQTEPAYSTNCPFCFWAVVQS